jgi:hypothetical protein
MGSLILVARLYYTCLYAVQRGLPQTRRQKMPQQLTPETRERYIRALTLRDNGCTFREIAVQCGYADAGTARYAWIGGLRISGREAEIPRRRPRQVNVTIGGQTVRLTVDAQESWSTTSTLTFGIEIECVGLNTRQAAHALRNAGIQCEDPGYTHATMATWKVVTDGSLTGRNGSCEVVSPVLSGSDGLTEVRTVMKVLREAGARINESCGMHIHIGVDTLEQHEQVQIMQAYSEWQWAFTAFVLQRRVNGSWSRLRTRSEWDSLIDAWDTTDDTRYVARNQDRYFAFNVASFQRHGTFELRSHHGSLNGTNACAWIAMHLAFFDAAKANDRDFFGRNLVGADWTKEVQVPRMVTQTDSNGNAVFDTNGRRMQTPMLDVNGQPVMTTRNDICDRAEGVLAAKAMLYLLAHNGYLAVDAATYLDSRAGNIPSARSINS